MSNTQNKSNRTAPDFGVSNSRSERAKTFITGQGEDVSKTDTTPVAVPVNSKISDKSYKACIRYMQNHGITDPNSLEFKRLNCDIPLELHNWLNVYARSSSEYNSMTEIVIHQLSKFAKERGFKVK